MAKMSKDQVLYDVGLMKEGGDYKGAQKILDKFIEQSGEDLKEIHFEAGIVAHKLDQVDKAELHFRKTLQLDPDDMNAVAKLAILLSKNEENYEEARALFERVIPVRSKDGHLWNQFGIMLTEKDPLISRKAFKKAQRIDPAFPDAFYNQAHLEWKQFRNIETSKNVYKKVLGLKSDHFDAAYDLGILCDEVGDNKESIVYFEKAHAIKPNDPNVEDFLAASHAKVGNLEALLRIYESQIAKSGGKDPYALHDKATLLHLKLLRYQEAEISYEQAICVKPDFATCIYNYAVLLETCLEDSEKAKDMFQRANELYPDILDANFCLGNYYWQIKDDAKKAHYYFARAVEVDPGHAHAWNNLGIVLESDEYMDWDGARHAYRQATESDPQIAFAQYNLGRNLKDHHKLYKKAKTRFEKALKLDKDLWQAHYNLGVMWHTVFNDPDKAVKALKASIRRKPEHAPAYFHMAFIQQHHKQNFRAALRNYGLCAQYDPDHSEAKNNMAVLLDSGYGKLQEAKVMYEDAIDDGHELPQLYFNFGSMLQYDFKDSVAAMEQYEKALELMPKYPEVHYNIGVIHEYVHHDTHKAKKKFQWVISREPDFYMAKVEMARILMKEGKLKRAKKLIQEALQIEPRSPTALCTKALLVYKMSSNGEDEALEMLRQVEKEHPDDFSTQHCLAVMLHKTRQYEKAKRKYCWLLKQSPDDAQLRFNYGLLLEVGYQSFKQAKKQYREAIKLDPLYATAYFNLGSLHLAIFDNKEKALRCMEKVCELDPKNMAAHAYVLELKNPVEH